MLARLPHQPYSRCQVCVAWKGSLGYLRLNSRGVYRQYGAIIFSPGAWVKILWTARLSTDRSSVQALPLYPHRALYNELLADYERTDSYAIYDALLQTKTPWIEVHVKNMYVWLWSLASKLYD